MAMGRCEEQDVRWQSEGYLRSLERMGAAEVNWRKRRRESVGVGFMMALMMFSR